MVSGTSAYPNNSTRLGALHAVVPVLENHHACGVVFEVGVLVIEFIPSPLLFLVHYQKKYAGSVGNVWALSSILKAIHTRMRLTEIGHAYQYRQQLTTVFTSRLCTERTYILTLLSVRSVCHFVTSRRVT